tara:strand:+ start:2999 stop:4066 length:1068 start_codon:yes stop_codon:yes gene_type:complete
MIFLLPIDVVRIILDFSTTLFDKKSIELVCKDWKKIGKSIYAVKKEINLKNKIRMLLEEKSSNLERSYENLALEWEKLNAHKWLLLHEKDKNLFVENDKTPVFYQGDIVDVKDRIGVWGAAKVVDLELLTPDMQFMRTNICRRRYKVKFLGWSRNYDEWVLPCNVKPLGTNTLNPLNKIKTLNKNSKKNVKIWLLVKTDEGWQMLSVKKTLKRPRVSPPAPPIIYDENPIPNDLSNNDLSNNGLLEPLLVNLNLPIIEPNITFSINETEQYDIASFINNTNNTELFDVSLNDSNDISNNNAKKKKEEKFIDLDTSSGRILIKKEDLNNRIINPTNASSFLLITSRYRPENRKLNL